MKNDMESDERGQSSLFIVSIQQFHEQYSQMQG